MPELIKPEHECPFDPKQYQCDCFIAPVGSFSWALIQLKLRKRVARSVWKGCQGKKGMYLAITPRVNNFTVEENSAYAADGISIGTKYDYLTHIDLRNEYGNFVPWQPTQEDMMACDWKLFKEPDAMLVFDLKSEFNDKSGYYGYLDVNKKSDASANPMGSLDIIQNNTGVKNVLIFHTVKNPGYIHFSVSFDEVNSQDVKKLIKKNLHVKVNDVTYILGTASEYSGDVTSSTHGFLYNYQSTDSSNKKDAEKLGEILKETGEVKRFYLTWCDE